MATNKVTVTHYMVVHTRRRMPSHQINTYWRYNLGVLIPYNYDSMVFDQRKDVEMTIRSCTDEEYLEIMSYKEKSE